MGIKIVPMLIGSVLTAAVINLAPPHTVYVGEGNGYACVPGNLYGSTCYKFNSKNRYQKAWAYSKTMSQEDWSEWMATYRSGFK